MKDEIKEILDNTLEYLEGIDETRNTKILTTNETYILLDYITNLQEKYERMKENAEILANGYNELEQRIDKAVVIIQNDTTLNPQRQRERLLNILAGGDSDE